MKVKVKAATGQALAWLTAQALGDEAPTVSIIGGQVYIDDTDDELIGPPEYDPADDPSVLVYILEKAHIVLVPSELPRPQWIAATAYGMIGRPHYCLMDGETASEAALRAFIGSVLGGEYDVPDELCLPPTDPATAG